MARGAPPQPALWPAPREFPSHVRAACYWRP